MLRAVRADLVFAARLLVRSPGFTAAAVAALALAIGANMTVFTLANAFLFKNLPFDDSDRIIYVSTISAHRSGTRGVSYPEFLDFRDQVPSFEGAGALTTGSVDLSDDKGFAERYRCAYVTPAAFAAIGQRPARGREFQSDDDRPGAAPVVILGDALWRARYGGDESILGRIVRINDVRATVIGVMARGMTFPGASDLWLPLRPQNLQRRDARTLTMFARLKRDASLRSARSEMTLVAARLASAYPATNTDIGVLVQNFNDRYNGGETPRLLFWLLWAVGFVLLIACANVANLLLARAMQRSREISIRSSLGASRWRVIRQLLIESLMLASLAGLLGIVLGIWGVRVFDAVLVPSVKPPYIDFSIDARVVAYLAAITCGTGILFGLAPALQLSKLDLTTALKEGGGVAGQGGRARRVSAMLVVAEVALAVILLAGAGLMIRSMMNTSRASIGIDPRNVLSFSVNLRRTKYPTPDAQVQFYDRLASRLQALPGVETMAVTSDLPAESPDEYRYEIEGAPVTDPRTQKPAAGLIVGERFFRALGVQPRSGREFQATDTTTAPPIAIVNDTFVKGAWPGVDPIGKRFRLVEENGDGVWVRGPFLTISGVVPDVLQDDESFEVSPVIYLPYRQRMPGGMEILVRTRVPPATVGESIRREVQALDNDLAVRTLRPLEESLWFRNWRHRVFGTMFAIFAGIALVLASVGLYAVIAQSVNQRTREIGVRMALGASSRNILRLIFGQAMGRFAIGLVIGLAGARAATGVLESMLVGVTSADPATFVAVSIILTAAGALGCALPARRAMKVDPVIALRRQ